MKSAHMDPPSESAASRTAGALHAGRAPQKAFLVEPNPRFGVRASWWTAIVLQQAYQAIQRSTDGAA